MPFGLTKQVLNESTLTNSFDRRSFVLGVGGLSVGILLAARMGYLAIAENDKYPAAPGLDPRPQRRTACL